MDDYTMLTWIEGRGVIVRKPWIIGKEEAANHQRWLRAQAAAREHGETLLIVPDAELPDA